MNKQKSIVYFNLRSWFRYCKLHVSRIHHPSSIIHRPSSMVLVILTLAFGLLGARSTEAALLDFLNFSNIPKHPLLEKVEERQSIINGAKAITIIYKADNNIDISKVINFYKDVLMQRGWIKSQESLSPDYSVVGFQDSDEMTDGKMRTFMLTIVRSPLIEGVMATVFYIPGGMRSWFWREDSEDNDMPGMDLDWFPRYPGAIRLQSIEEQTGVTTIQYLIAGYSCINCTVQFYKEHMLNNGWQLQGSSYQDKDQIQKAQANSALGMKKIISQLKNEGLLNNVDLEGYEASLEAQEEMQQPSEIYSLQFEKKGNVCAVGINYKEAEVGVNMMTEQVEKFIEASKEVKGGPPPTIEGESIEKFVSRIRPYYHQTQMNKESVMVSVIYMPKKSMQRSSKRSGFRMRGAR